MKFDIQYMETLKVTIEASSQKEALNKFKEQIGSTEEGVEVLEIKQLDPGNRLCKR